MPVRQPIVCVLGHIDTGKTLLLDRIRKSSVQAREAGGITQHIGASFFPLKTLEQICGPLLKRTKSRIKIPGLLVIDTPGHEAFANLRKRGGGVADIAILAIDALRGFEAQTRECIEILKARKTPFLVAANKIDRLPGWKSNPNDSFLTSYQAQDPYVRRDLDERIYTILGTFSRIGFRADRFDKISDFTQNVAVVPVSAKTGEGIPELLAVLVGLAQQFLRAKLKVTKGPAKGTILEVTEDPGLGITVNAVIYDGILKKGDTIVVGGKEKPLVTKVRAALLPKPLDEIRDPRDRFSLVDMVSAATGVKIAAPNLEDALAGAPMYVVPSKNLLRKFVRTVSEEIEEIRIATDMEGVVLKTDTLGSLEAIAESLKQKNVPIRLADVGDVSKRDVMEAVVVKEHEPLHGVIIAFNVKTLRDAEEEARNRNVPIFKDTIIYSLIDEYAKWLRSRREMRLQEEFDGLIKPGKMKILPGYVFRRAKPAIVGIEVLAGQIKPKCMLARKDGSNAGEIIQIQDRGEAISEAKTGMQVAISVDKSIVGRHIYEKDILYVRVPEEDAKALLTKFQDRLPPKGLEILMEFVNLMRRESPFWAA
ncbi:MAG: translation initiation factor IF-2 [Candidatus Bathyarchaeota archaeon]|nr:MAG: translation initiation factor IF-2 [Candidatus Bathyarchaeota archaeon]